MSAGPGRAARRRARRPPPPLSQRDGLDPVHHRLGPADPGVGATALAALAARFPPLLDPAATPLAQRFAAGEVVDAHGVPWTAGQTVRAGDELWFHREPAPEDVPDISLSVLLHDEHLLVIDKPPGVATMPRGAHVFGSALVRLRRATGITALSPVHRLDLPTRGVLAFSVMPTERAAYQQLFARGEVAKEYRARVVPAPGADMPAAVGERTVLVDRLEKTRGVHRTAVVAGEPNALTEVELLALEPDGTRLLSLRPRTGRTHQLRAQLAARGAPILGDELYRDEPGGTSRAPGQVPDIPGQGLQLLARRLAFHDPVTGQERSLTSAQDLDHGPTGR